MVMQTDGSGNKYLEFSIGHPKEERLRATVITNSKRGGPAIRLNVKEANGHLRQGPEMPLSTLAELAASFPELLTALQPEVTE